MEVSHDDTRYHRQFWEAAEARYLDGDTGVAMHSALASYFRGEWASVAKPHQTASGETEHAVRFVDEQPLVLRGQMSVDRDPVEFNQRRLSELVYNLMESGQWFVSTVFVSLLA